MSDDSVRTAFRRGQRAPVARLIAGIPEVAYTRQHLEQPEDFPLPRPIEWEPEPETPEPAGLTADQWRAQASPPAKIYPWSFWYHDQEGSSHQVILEATYKDAQRAWDALDAVFGLTSRRP